MPPKLLHVLIEKYQVAVPDSVNEFGLPEFLIQELSANQLEEILCDYGYAGKAVCHYLILNETIPSIVELELASKKFPPQPEKVDHPEQDSPLFEYGETDVRNSLFRVRFSYFHDTQTVYDPDTSLIKQWFSVYNGTMVLRPGKRLIEVRASHRPIVRQIAYRAMATMKLPSMSRLNLYTEKFVQSFLQWINSLNNARLTFSAEDELSAISLSAKRAVDLRTTDKFKEYFHDGYLRGAHVTIGKPEEHQINFRIFFRDTRVTFTSFANENEISLVADGLERISGGGEFRGPRKILEQFFE